MMTVAVVEVFGGKETVNGALVVLYAPPKLSTATERLPLDALYIKPPDAVMVEFAKVTGLTQFE